VATAARSPRSSICRQVVAIDGGGYLPIELGFSPMPGVARRSKIGLRNVHPTKESR
jgi:hypothetical protein